jgi:uncharacterized membrane protein
MRFGLWRALTAKLRAVGPPDAVAIAVATLALVGASLVYTVQVLALKNRADFLLFNNLGGGPRGRNLFVITVILGAVLPNLLALGYHLWTGRADRVLWLARVLAPLSLTFLLPSLFTWQFGRSRPMVYLVTLGIFGLGLRQLLPGCLTELKDRLRWDEWRPPPRWIYTLVVVLASLAYAVYMSFFTIRNHHLVGTTAFDLGIYDNLLFNAKHGRFFHSPVLFGPGDHNYLAGHAEFAMLLYVPFYAIRPSAETMLVIQAATLGASAIPLYLFARRLVPTWGATVLALCYLMFAPLHGPQFYDFHWLPLSMFFVFWMIYGVVSERRWVTVLSVLVVYAIREDTALGVAFFGLFLMVTGWRPRTGFVLAATASVWFVVVRFVIMPLAGPWYFANLYNGLFSDGDASFQSVIRTLITNPDFVLTSLLKEDKVLYVLHMLAPLAFLPVRRLVHLLLFIGGAIITILTTDNPPMVSIAFQYTSHWIPYLFLATALALAGLGQVRTLRPGVAASLIALAITVASHSYNFGAVLQHEAFVGGFRQINFTFDDFAKERYANVRKLTDQIPRTASVAATEYMNPHISARLDAFVLRWDCGDVDYVFVSNREMGETARKSLNVMFKRKSYGLLGKTGNEFYLFKRGYQSAETTAALATLGLDVPAH